MLPHLNTYRSSKVLAARDKIGSEMDTVWGLRVGYCLFGGAGGGGGENRQSREFAYRPVK